MTEQTNGGRKAMLGSSKAYVITLLSLLAGMVFATFYPAAPYGVFAPTVGVVFGAYITKRLIQKQEKYGGETEVCEEKQ